MRFDGPFHQSDINDYLKCARMFFLKNFMAQIPEKRSVKMVNGSAMHLAIRRLHEDWSLDPKRIYADALNYYESEGPEKDIPVAWDASDKDREQLINEAWAILENYRAKPFNQNCKVILAEAPFAVEIGGYKFEGKIDQARMVNGELWLPDFKTGNSRPDKDALGRDYQFGIYALACRDGKFKVNGSETSLAQLPERLIWYATYDHLPYRKKTTRDINGVATTFLAGQERGPAIYDGATELLKHLVAFERDIQRVCGAMRMGLFYKNPLHCKMGCRFKLACDADIKEGSLTYSQTRRLTTALAEEEE